jgi:hypothetical protein
MTTAIPIRQSNQGARGSCEAWVGTARRASCGWRREPPPGGGIPQPRASPWWAERANGAPAKAAIHPLPAAHFRLRATAADSESATRAKADEALLDHDHYRVCGCVRRRDPGGHGCANVMSAALDLAPITAHSVDHPKETASDGGRSPAIARRGREHVPPALTEKSGIPWTLTLFPLAISSESATNHRPD